MVWGTLEKNKQCLCQRESPWMRDCERGRPACSVIGPFPPGFPRSFPRLFFTPSALNSLPPYHVKCATSWENTVDKITERLVHSSLGTTYSITAVIVLQLHSPLQKEVFSPLPVRNSRAQWFTHSLLSSWTREFIINTSTQRRWGDLLSFVLTLLTRSLRCGAYLSALCVCPCVCAHSSMAWHLERNEGMSRQRQGWQVKLTKGPPEVLSRSEP